MNKKKLIIIAVWGNITGFFSMRILGRLNDYTPSFEQSNVTDLFAIIIFFVILGLPGAYFYTIKKSREEDVGVGYFIAEIFETATLAFFLGLLGIILGRIS